MRRWSFRRRKARCPSSWPPGVGALAAVLYAAPALAAQATIGGSADTAEFCCRHQHFVPAAAELVAAQVIPWYFNRHVAVDSTAALSWSSWGRNLERGFEWDPNSFATNMFLHPYHGNVYFNAARTNGYGFSESSALAWGGSLIWEMFGENNPAAINDWVNTSMGGIALGELLFRASRAVLDNEATGSERTWREFGNFLLNPFGGFNRLIRGEMTRIGPNPDDRLPSRLAGTLMFGYRSVADGTEPNSGRNVPYVDLTVEHGDHLQDFDNPFDAFTLRLQMNASRSRTLGRLQVDGTLYGKVWKQSDQAVHVIGVDHHYDYFNNETYVVGGQSFGVTLRSRFRVRDDLLVRTLVEPVGAVIWAVSSEYDEVTGRDYDFGSGAGMRTNVAVNRSGVDILTLGYTGVYSHTLSGPAGNHVVHMVALGVRAPLIRRFGVAMEYLLFMRNSFYRDLDDVHERNPQFRVSAAYFP